MKYLHFSIIFVFVLSVFCQQSGHASTFLHSIQPFASNSSLHLPVGRGRSTLFQWPNDQVLPDQTAEIFLLAEGLMELGRMAQSNREVGHSVRELGHLLISGFYDDPNNYTSYGPIRTPYMNTALAITELELDNLLLTIFTNNVQSFLSDIRTILQNAQPASLPPMTDVSDGHLRPYFDHLRGNFLVPVRDEILQNPYLSDHTVLIIEDSFETYMEAIDQLQMELENALTRHNADGQPNTYSHILTGVESAYHQFFDRFSWSENANIQQLKASATEQVQTGNERLNTLSIRTHNHLAPLGESITDIYRTAFYMQVLLKQHVADHYRRKADQEAWWGNFTKEDWFGVKDFARKGTFSLLSSGFQLGVHTNRWLQNQVAQPLFDMAQEFHNRPYSTLLLEHADTLNASLPQIALIISTHLIHNLEALLEPSYAYDSLHNILGSEVQNRFFTDQSHLPGIELSNIGMVRDGYRIAFSRVSDYNTLTNGETLGTAMSVLTERLNGLTTFEDREGQKDDLLFSLLNKSLSLLGMRTLEKSEDVYVETHPVSFFRPFYREQNQGREDHLRAWSYLQNRGFWQQQATDLECLGDEERDSEQAVQQEYFAIPDRLVLGERPFSIDLEQLQDGLATVASQAELIRGGAKVLKYLSTRQEGDLEGLDLNYEGIHLFPSVSLFHIHLALVTVNLHNLLRGGVALYDRDRKPTFVRVGGTDLPEHFQWASVHGVKEGEETFYWTSTVELARLIIAIEEFIAMAEDLALEDLQHLPDMPCIERVNYQQIKDNLPNLSAFVLALSGYMMTFLQGDDGGFVDYYTMDMDLEDASRSLRTQVLAMHALTTSYRRVQNAEMKTAVLRSFRYTTEHLFDSHSGFYVTSEGGSESPDLLLTIDILRLLYRMDTLFERENIYVRNDLRNLRTRWVSSLDQQLAPLKTALSD